MKAIGSTLLGFMFVAGSTLAVGLTMALLFWVVGLSFGGCPRCD